MAQQIEVPGMGVVEFPDEMSDDEIASVIRSQMQQAQPEAVKAPTMPTVQTEPAAKVPFFAEQATERAPWEPAPEMIPGVARGFAQGLTFNAADELAGLLGGDSAGFRTAQKQFREEHPYISTASEIAGGLAQAALPLKLGYGTRIGGAGPAAGFARHVGLPAGVGAAYGAASGFGEGETFDERVSKALTGAGVGALATPTMQAAAKILGGAGKRLYEMMPWAKASPEHGMKMLASVMKEEGLDPNVIQKQVDDMTAATGKPVMWLDLIDANKYPRTYDLASKSLLGGTSTAPKMKVIERGEGTTERLVEDIKTGIHKAPERSYAQTTQEATERSTEWKKAFDPIKKVSVDTPEVMEVLNRPFARHAIETAIEVAKDRGDKQALSLFGKFTRQNPDTGKFEMVRAPTLELIQAIKNLGYTPALQAVFKGTSKVSADTSAILKQQRDLLKAVDDAIPEYANVRKNFASSADISNARELGANLQKTLSQGTEDVGGKIAGYKSEDVIDEFRNMGKVEQDAFLQGLAKTLSGKVRKKGESASGIQYASIIGEPGATSSERLSQLREIVGDNDKFRNFLERLQTEKTIEKTSKEFATRRGAGYDDLGGAQARDIVRTGGAAALGRLATAIPAIGSTIGRFVSGQTPKRVQPIAELVASQAGSTNPLIRMLSEKYGQGMGDITVRDVMTPFLTSATFGEGLRQGANLEYRRGGLAQYQSR